MKAKGGSEPSLASLWERLEALELRLVEVERVLEEEDRLAASVEGEEEG